MESVAYEGKKVFIGIDVHKRQYTVCCRSENQIVNRCTMSAYPEGLYSFIRKHFAGAEVFAAYEAGFSAFALQRYLSGVGINCIVVHPLSIEVSGKKVRTDKRDAARIADQLECGKLRGNRVPTVAEESQRLLPRTRAQLVRTRTRAANQMRMKLHQFGLIGPEDRERMSPVKAQKILAGEVSEELKISMNALISIWAAADQQIRLLNQELKKSENPIELVYKQVPGIGALTAHILARELGDMSQFTNEKKLSSFLGLTPSEDTSDETRRLGHITRQGNSYLRHLLTEAAWVAVRKDPALRRVFVRLVPRTGKKRAVIAVARRLASRARAILRKKENYQMGSELAA